MRANAGPALSSAIQTVAELSASGRKFAEMYAESWCHATTEACGASEKIGHIHSDIGYEQRKLGAETVSDRWRRVVYVEQVAFGGFQRTES